MTKKLSAFLLALSLGACTTASTVPDNVGNSQRLVSCHECAQCKCQHCKKEQCNCAHNQASVKQGEICNMNKPAQ